MVNIRSWLVDVGSLGIAHGSTLQLPSCGQMDKGQDFLTHEEFDETLRKAPWIKGRMHTLIYLCIYACTFQHWKHFNYDCSRLKCTSCFAMKKSARTLAIAKAQHTPKAKQTSWEAHGFDSLQGACEELLSSIVLWHKKRPWTYCNWMQLRIALNIVDILIPDRTWAID